MCVQALGAVDCAGHLVTLTPSCRWPVPLGLSTKLRSVSSVVPAELILTSASPSPRVVRPAPTFFRSVSMAPKYDGVAPKWPFHRFTWNGSQASPSTAIDPSLPKVMAGSLFPVEFAFGAGVMPVRARGELRGVLVKAGVAPAIAAVGRTTAAVASTDSAPRGTSFVRIELPFIRARASLRLRSAPAFVRALANLVRVTAPYHFTRQLAGSVHGAGGSPVEGPGLRPAQGDRRRRLVHFSAA